MSDATVTQDQAETGTDVTGFAMDGISYLIAVTQLKASNANDQAMAGANAPRHLIAKQGTLLATQRSLEPLTNSCRLCK